MFLTLCRRICVLLCVVVLLPALTGVRIAALALSDHWQTATPSLMPLQPACAQTPEALEPGQSRTNEIAGGQRQCYLLRLEKGQYLKVIVEQNQADVDLDFYDVDKRQAALATRDPKGQIPEILETVAEQTGLHVLQVVSKETGEAVRKSYLITLVEIRPATAREQILARAEKQQRESFILRRDGKYAQALAVVKEAMVARKEQLGAESADYAESVNQAGLLYIELQDYVNAQAALAEALAIREKILSPLHPIVSSSLNNVGMLYSILGALEKAEEKLVKSLRIREQLLGKTHSDLAAQLNNLGAIYLDMKRFAEAETAFLRAIKVMEDGQPDGLIIARVYTNLAGVYRAQEAYEKAEKALKHALGIIEKKSDANHPNRANTLTMLGSIQFLKGEYSQAATSLQQALQIYEQSLGLLHPRIAEALNHLSNVYRATGKISQAIETRRTASAIREESLRRNLILGSERQKLDFFQQYAKETAETLALHVQFAPEVPAALEMAFTVWLQRKGRVLDEMHQSIGVLREAAGPETAALFERYAEQRREVAQLVTSGAREPKKIENLWQEIDRLAELISQHSARFRTQTQPVTLAAVRNSLPAQSALVDFVRYQPVATGKKKHTQVQYAAYVMLADGALDWAPLGSTEKIDSLIKAWRSAIDPKRKQPLAYANKLARQLDMLVMQPVRKQLRNDIKHLLVSPDGYLNLIPFAALVDEGNKYLVTRYSFTYLTSGRDLLRLDARQESGKDVVILADPDFGTRMQTRVAAKRDIKAVHDGSAQFAQLPQSLAVAFFLSLPGTADEAAALKSLLPEARLLTQSLATKTALRQIKHPRILHLATHGFFLRDAGEPANDKGRGLKKVALNGIRNENPYLRSGLALAGVNNRKSDDDDGILTALEAAGLDLWGTKLVVLSACNTGVGEIKNGDGVYGLRRAFVLAGSETQVMSLWSVSDQGTKELMVEYYKRLLRGEGRGEALRQVQLQMLKNPKRSHPFYWASFIQSGEWANLDGKR